MLLPACSAKLEILARKLDAADAATCARLNRLSRLPNIRNGFRIVSRLGGGMIWYTLMAALPLAGSYDGLWISVQMAMTALAGLVIYKLAKHVSGRERPYVQHADRVACALPPLDRYSFPSGHTLHAISFTLVPCSHVPAMIRVLSPFALLVTLSRMIPGLPYPSDVLAAAFIGAILGLASPDVFSLPGIR